MLGADVNIVNTYGRTPLHYAAVAEVKAVRLSKMLIKAGADTQARTR
jgi:ankyrin repeat protein